MPPAAAGGEEKRDNTEADKVENGESGYRDTRYTDTPDTENENTQRSIMIAGAVTAIALVVFVCCVYALSASAE